MDWHNFFGCIFGFCNIKPLRLGFKTHEESDEINAALRPIKGLIEKDTLQQTAEGVRKTNYELVDFNMGR